MSKVVKAVKKTFKKVKKAVKKVGKFIKKHWKTIALVAVGVFTAGAALGYVGMGAGGGLVFGSGAGVGGLSGVTTAFGALGNTVMGAVGLGTPFGGTVTANSASVMGMGTGGMTTGSGMTVAAGETAKFGGGGLLSQGSLQGAQQAATVVSGGGPAPASLAQTPGATSASGAPASLNPTHYAADGSLNAAGMENVSAAADTVQKAGAAKNTADATKAGLTFGEKLQLGGVAFQGLGAYMNAQAREEELDAARDSMKWDYSGDLGSVYGASKDGVRFVPGQGLMRPSRMAATNRMVMMDDVARARYGVA